MAEAGSIYAILRRRSDGAVWNRATESFEVWAAANVADYAIAAVPEGGHLYSAGIPASVPTGTFRQMIYEQQGATPAAGDLHLGPASTFIRRDGTNTEFGDHLSTHPAGTGDVVVNHNYGGIDALRVMRGADGVDNATIRAYVKADYDAGRLASRPPTTFTGSDGRWNAPLMLDPDTYMLAVYDPLARTTKQHTLIVTSDAD